MRRMSEEEIRGAAPAMTDRRWLTEFCLARVAFSFIFTSYSAAMPMLLADWSMSAAQAGSVQSAWHFGYLVSLFAVGLLGDRFGAKRVYLVSAVAASGSALLFAGLASSYATGLAFHFLAGLCSGGSYTPGLVLISERFPSGLGRSMGAYLAAGSLGYALSMAVSAQLFPLGGWRLALWATCALPTLGMLLSFRVLRGSPNVVHESSGVPALRAVLAALRNRAALLSMLAYTFHCWELFGMWAWMPAFLTKAAQISASETGTRAAAAGVMLTGLTYLTSMLGSLIGGALSDRVGRTATMLLFSCLSMAASFSFGWLLGWPLWAMFLLAAAYNLSCIADSSVYSTSLTELVEPRSIGAAYAVRSVLGFGAGVLSPWVFGLTLDAMRPVAQATEAAAWGPAWMTLGVGALPGLLMIWMLRRRPESAAMAQGRK